MTVLVLKTLSDLGRRSSRCNEELHFSVDETFFEEENNPRGSSLSQKFSFSCFFLQMAAKSSTLSHVSFLMSMMRTKSTRALSFSFYQHFAVQNDQLRLKSSKTVLKAFQLIFP
jgi:hypothetical protein